MSSYEAAMTLGTLAVPAAWALGGAITVAVSGAMWEAVSPGTPTRVGWATVRGLVWLLRALVWVPLLPWRLAVTYLHVGMGKRSIRAKGHHRPSVVAKWAASGTYNMRASRQPVRHLVAS